MTRRNMLDLVVRAARRLAGRGCADVDYRRWYAAWDLGRDYWSIVGPASREEYERLGAVKLRLLLDLGLTPDARVLDVGCGTGLLTTALEKYLGDRGLYCGTDIAPEAVAFCRRRFGRANFTFHVSTMTELRLSGVAFDFVVFYSVFTHTYPDETALLLREARRVLADGGVIFADVFTSTSPRRYSGGRDAVVVNRDHFLRLVADCGLRAKPVTAHPWGRDGQRLFLEFAPHQSTTAPSSASYSSRFFQS